MESFKGSPRPKPRNSTKEKRASRLFHPRTKIEEAQEQVNEITDIMRHNMQSVIERDIKLSELDDRMTTVSERAKLFQGTTKKVQEKAWRKNIKWRIVWMVIVSVLLLAACIMLSLWLLNLV